MENQARDEAIRDLAQEKMNNQLDLVKLLRGMAAEAEAFTIRDTQLMDRQNKANAEKVGDHTKTLTTLSDREESLSHFPFNPCPYMNPRSITIVWMP